MRMRARATISTILVALTAASALVGCGGGSSNDDGPAAPATAPLGATAATGSGVTAATGSTRPVAAALNCDDAWKKYVELHPAGFAATYTTTSVTKGGSGDIINSSQYIYEDAVQESNDAHILSTRTTTTQGLPQPVVKSTDLSKAEFVGGCSKINGALGNVLTGAPTDISLQIIEKSTQSLTVGAGTFTADYIRGTTGSLGTGTTAFQNWSLQDGSTIIVKTILETTTDVGGAVMTGTITTELTKLVRP